MKIDLLPAKMEAVPAILLPHRQPQHPPVKIKTGCYTIRVGNADEVYGFAIRNTEGKKLGDERSKLT